MRSMKGGRTLPCDNTVADGLRVKWSSGNGNLTACGATDHAVGIVDGVPQNGYCVIINPNTEDGVKMVSAGNIAIGATVYGAANGQISASSSGGAVACGVNWTPSAVAGSFCDVQTYPTSVG